MNRSKIYRAIHESMAQKNPRWFAVLNYRCTEEDGKDAFLFLAFPALEEVDAVLEPMMTKAAELYQATQCPVKCILFVEDDDYPFYAMNIVDGNLKEIYDQNKVSATIYNTSIMSSCLDDALEEGRMIPNLQIFMYAYHEDIDDKLWQIANDKQMAFLQRDWSGLMKSISLLKDFVRFLMLDEFVCH